MEPMQARTISVSIRCDARRVYDFVAKPEHLPDWAKGLCLSVKKNGDWTAETLSGRVRIRFTERNDFGVLDHYVTLSTGATLHVPMRVVPNGSGSEVLLTIFRQKGMTEQQYAEDIRLVEQDLRNLKRIMESDQR